MREVDLQSLIIKAVQENGGASHKLSNRFLVGVVDLLIKLPNIPAMVMEVKITDFRPGISSNHKIRLDVTHLQQNFLKQYHKAGMIAGVISGVEIGRNIRLACVGLDEADDLDYTMTVEAHRFNARDPAAIVRMLTEVWK